MKYIKRNPRLYEESKAQLRRFSPLPKRARRLLTAPLRRFHQVYLVDFVFVHINKCGGTSMERALGLPFINHATALEHRSVLGERRWSNRFVFSLVRNPYFRLASMYLYQSSAQSCKVSTGDFTRWLEEIARRNRLGIAGPKISPQLSWLADQEGKLIVDKWYRLEQIEEKKSELEGQLGFSLNLQRLNNQSKAVSYRELFDAQSSEIILDTFADDFSIFGYSKDLEFATPFRTDR